MRDCFYGSEFDLSGLDQFEIRETRGKFRFGGGASVVGVAKLVADGERGVLVGGSMMGPAAGEMIGLLVLAIRQRIPVDQLRDLIFPYPTFVRDLEDALNNLSAR